MRKILIVLSILASACIIQKEAILPEKGSLKWIRIQDENSRQSYVYVLGPMTCEEINLQQSDSTLEISCFEFDFNSKFLVPFTYNKTRYAYNFGSDGEIILEAPYCTKSVFNLHSADSGAKERAVTIHLDSVNHSLKFYVSDFKNGFPFYIDTAKDSSAYDLKKICSEEEIESHITDHQRIYERNIQIDISPNPFQDKFSFRMTCEKMWLTGPEEKILRIKDKHGNTLLEQIVTFNTSYQLELSGLPKGEIAFYTVSWGQYKIAGKILKSK